MLLHVLRSQLSFFALFMLPRATCPSHSVRVMIESSRMEVVVISSSESDWDDSAARPSSPGFSHVFTPIKCPPYPSSSESRLVFETLKENGNFFVIFTSLYLPSFYNYSLSESEFDAETLVAGFCRKRYGNNRSLSPLSLVDNYN